MQAVQKIEIGPEPTELLSLIRLGKLHQRGADRMCVLVVDDEPVIRMNTEEHLADAGHRVMTAEHGVHAMELIDRHPNTFSALVTDFRMPHEVTGADVVEYMRAGHADIPVLLTTADPSMVSREWCHKHRVKLVSKPYALSAIKQALAHLLV